MKKSRTQTKRARKKLLEQFKLIPKRNPNGPKKILRSHRNKLNKEQRAKLKENSDTTVDVKPPVKGRDVKRTSPVGKMSIEKHEALETDKKVMTKEIKKPSKGWL